MAPERFVDFKERVSKWSRESRKVERKLKLVLTGVKLRSMAETRESVQEMPEKLHGFWSGSQLERKGKDGFGRLVLKLMSCWVSLFGEEDEEVGEAWRER